jgi:hypothetical protein
MAKKPIRALVTVPTYINGVLHHPGEVAHVDLEALGVDKLGEQDVTVTDADGKEHTFKRDLTPGLKEHKGEEPVTQVPVAAVSPHAPDAPNPQGIPPGTVQSGTGRLIHPVDMIEGTTQATPEAIEPVGADKPGVEGEQTPTKPSKSK